MKINTAAINLMKLAGAGFSMFLLLVGLTFYPIIISDKVALVESGFLFIILYTIEFSFIVPLFLIFFRKQESMGKGSFNIKQFLVLLFLILLVQLAGAYILDIRRTENWMVEQESIKGGLFWLNILMLIFIVPIYEELVFRGCLLSALLTFFRGNIFIASLVTSLLFALLHTQYTDIRTLIILFLISIILISARIVSKGILMPIVLHMAMNGIILGLS
ncbi:CPBP family intramembrane glutamic endopeptidase [Serratia marcescens]|uniref:CPBP family intramembrane glutamic endopeptidase n=1 Tax=Serratia marcescens TaxID=615 RepID=UPI000F0BE3AC|nr:type II CAAX endopeptidase family protein [Serratia marcescens]BBG71946.1 CAAX amino protease [Serratia marcescens]